MAKPRDELLTIPQVLNELPGVSRSTFYRWRQLRKGPKSIKLPNGSVRIRRSEFNRWLADREDAA
ncbi:helix-turn-helix transcriptional regulator [Streptomyces hiroshimensis]|uniref:Excisionase n=1 Tax=Streptomyces hiroshimensis TaxID=66424 RepID=A0ABQ2YFM8_9ACTN|nr:helix-turn-helix domain-containing protein [Streptomyces hiroshimensis]GGX82456.1 excisionase [Streptomyces hiroshimensis]